MEKTNIIKLGDAILTPAALAELEQIQQDNDGIIEEEQKTLNRVLCMVATDAEGRKGNEAQEAIFLIKGITDIYETLEHLRRH